MEHFEGRFKFGPELLKVAPDRRIARDQDIVPAGFSRFHEPLPSQDPQAPPDPVPGHRVSVLPADRQSEADDIRGCRIHRPLAPEEDKTRLCRPHTCVQGQEIGAVLKGFKSWQGGYPPKAKAAS